jgi:hypothetical protein
MAVSYLAVQVFKYQLGTQFWALPHAQPLSVVRSDHLPSSAFLSIVFLCALNHAPEVTPFGLKVFFRWLGIIEGNYG